ncbi:MAG: aromatic aminobenezylarsenical efflux permease ArsG family transporter [Planctomycetota bacterium]|nr:aromatic aminobenezylarsenical efflux permease ArsG family transporter [Planctomycetota bacterium]
MDAAWWIGISSAAWLGILTAISPCPLATNIAAISFISKKIDRPSYVLTSGLVYTFGRLLTYVVLAVLLVNALLEAPKLSVFLQNYINMFLAPLLILAGMYLLELISFGIDFSVGKEKAQKLADKGGLAASFVLGVLFALSFCPVSAALFFVTLIPLAVKFDSGILFPSVYGAGTGLPVVVFSVLVSLGASRAAAAFNKISRFEKWARYVTGTVFILAGIYMSLEYIFKVL